MATTIEDKKLKSLIKESVKEVLETELMKLRALALPDVSKGEQSDIEKRYGKLSKRKAKSYSLDV
ncbi:hypothetical protein IIA94_00250 [Patescibacteria group bacterium]|nr:hypothetical protein [Patescibacteria group bacterium]